jgi:hypothetical protein
MTEMLNILKKSYNDLHYTWFDFHKECSGMKYEKLSVLISSVKKELQDWGHFICEINCGLDKRQEIKPELIQIA